MPVKNTLIEHAPLFRNLSVRASSIEKLGALAGARKRPGRVGLFRKSGEHAGAAQKFRPVALYC